MMKTIAVVGATGAMSQSCTLINHPSNGFRVRALTRNQG